MRAAVIRRLPPATPEQLATLTAHQRRVYHALRTEALTQRAFAAVFPGGGDKHVSDAWDTGEYGRSKAALARYFDIKEEDRRAIDRHR